MTLSAARYAAVLVCALPVLLCSGCANKFTRDQIATTVHLVSDTARPQALSPEESVTIYVEGNVLAGQEFFPPVKREAPPVAFHPIARIKLEWAWAWDNKCFDDYPDPHSLHPLVVDEARIAARRLGCNALVISKEVTPNNHRFQDRIQTDKFLILGLTKAFGIILVAGSTQ